VGATTAHSVSFGTAERYTVLAVLGEGASGTVYRAHDRLRNATVALKTLTNMEPEQRYRFKREFRALSDVHDPHLVELLELTAEGDPWFFTMELVEGQDFLAHFRGAGGQHSSRPSPLLAAAPENSQALDLGRLRSAFAQLCTGLHALHLRGLLHRDVKPSNVLVAQDGRVVLVDFGIIAELRKPSNQGGSMLGTPAYMAPEQVLDEPVTAAADWYAVGVMLFEALTGRQPFVRDALSEKIEGSAPRASDQAAEVPPDLDALCAALLQTESAQRPGFDAIMRALGGSHEAPTSGWSEAFIGREQELAALVAALGSVRPGAPVLALMPGTSGLGKSALLERFGTQQRESGTAVVLASRCSERESVPFRALDGAIDALALRLSQDSTEPLPLSPDEAAALVRIFPVLGQVPQFGAALHALHKGGIGHASLRAHAVSGLRALFRKLAGQGALVLAIDDAQWGDADSASLLSDLYAAPEAPGILVVLAYRREWEGRAPLLVSRTDSDLTVQRIEVDRLPDSRARALAAHLLARSEDDPAVTLIVSESDGSPFAITELARHVLAVGQPQAGLQLRDVLGARFGQLDEPSRRVLQALSVAARPLELELAARAANLAAEQGAHAIRVLRQAHLVRESDSRGGARRLEPFHDRLREAMVDEMGEDTVRMQHVNLLTALQDTASPDADALYRHSLGAGQTSQAAEYAARAALHAVAGMAFMRGAELFRAALELVPDDSRAHEWRIGRARALEHAGRPQDAADAYLEAAAAPGVPSDEALLLECAAVEQYLGGGYHEQGMSLAERTLRAVGTPLASTRNAALFSTVVKLALLRLRGTRFTEKSERDLPRELATRIDAVYRVARGVCITDPIRGGELFLRTLRLAFEAGEIKRVSVGLGFLATMLSSEGPSPHNQRLMDQSAKLAARSGDGHTQAVQAMNSGAAYALNGFFRESIVELERANGLFDRERRSFERTGARNLYLFLLFYLGRLREMCREVPVAVADAGQCGDAYSRSLLITSKASLCWLAADQPDVHAALLRTGVTSEPRNGVLSIEHITAMGIGADHDLYLGQAERAAARLSATMPAAKASLLLRMVITGVQTYDAQARVALALALQGKDVRANLALALGCAKLLEKRNLVWPSAVATMVRAGIADASGNAERALELYRQAVLSFEQQGLFLHAVAARHRAGLWLGGDEGATLCRDAESWLREQCVVAPTRFLAMMAPSARG
jgi:serine/threonine protein kinase/tetratricopeptide (TPR) repeat protein